MDTVRNRSVLVTGSRGFVGRALCKLLQRENYRVVALDQPPNSPPADSPASGREVEREVQCDISDATRLQSVFEAEQIGGIVHLAAVLPTAAQRDPLRATQVNIGGSLNLLETSRRFGVQRMVFASSLSIYGTCPLNEQVSETHRVAPEDLYGAAKLYVEQLGEAYRNSYGMEFVSLRIGRVVGPGAQSVTSAWRSQIFEELQTEHTKEILLPFKASERILLVHVEDVAKMLLTLLQVSDPAHLAYNAPCESLIVSELKRELESLNPNIRIRLGNEDVVGNPRLLDVSRFEQEFCFRTMPIFDQLKRAAGK